MDELTPRFEEALVYSFRLHARQWRKGSRVPYMAHLLSVAALVMENGGDEDQAIAALLHDAVEDQGGLDTLEQIRTRFGDRVALIVKGCSDTLEQHKPPWRVRKEHYLALLPHEPSEVYPVSLADKLHNARSLLSDLKKDGQSTWKKFNGGKEGTLWYYHRLVEVFREIAPGSLSEELARLVEVIATFA